MSLNRLFSFSNLELAWRRINTASNLQYKRFFRDLHYAYEIASIPNLKDLQTRLKGRSYQPRPSTRIYIPKPSGLQRPITLISLEDQIVWQAIANIFAKRLRSRRSKVELKSVFSNISQPDKDNIFFVRSWKYSYGRFLDKIEDYYNKGYRWIAHFDLAAFYDTISHQLLLRTLFPRKGGAEFRTLVANWMLTWSAEKPTFSHGHGIPQGPIASDFTAECFFLSIDEVMSTSRDFKYLRYVDDIRLFAKGRTQLRRAAVKLEVLCRNKGLIPHAKKYDLKEAESIEDARGSLPSIRIAEDETFKRTLTLPKNVAVKNLRKALEGKPQRIKDKTRARYIFFNAEPCAELTRYAARLLLSHPEHVDAFIHYFSHCRPSPIIIRACREKLQKTPYEYVQGELWHILARMTKPKEMKGLIDRAINIAKDRKAGIAIKWGALHFLCNAESKGLGPYSRFVQYQDSSLLQALLVPVIPDSRYRRNDVVGKLIRRTSFEPGIMLAEQLLRMKLTHNSFGRRSSQLPTQVQNVYRELGIIRGPRTAVDPMGEILSRRYGVPYWNGWRQLLAIEYVHARQILSHGDAVFKSGRSKWLQEQNSFNHALFLAIQKQLHSRNIPGAAKLIGRDGRAIQYGVLLDKNQIFSRTYPVMADGLRLSNDRRNSLPGSHPYKDSGKRARWLTKSEQDEIKKKLKTAYQEIINVFDTVL